MRGFFLPLSILLFLFLSLLLPSVHCAWFVREVYSNTGCNTLSNVLVQELDTCYSDGVESNKYELNSAGNVLDKDCSDDECIRCSFAGPPESVDSTECQSGNYKQYISPTFPAQYGGTITVTFRNTEACLGDLSAINIVPGDCTDSKCDEGTQKYCTIPSFLQDPTPSPTDGPTNSPTNSPTDGPTTPPSPPYSPSWLVREFYTQQQCLNQNDSLVFAVITDINSCYLSKVGENPVSSVKVNVTGEEYADTWNCVTLDCNGCTNLAYRQQLGECSLYSSKFYFNENFYDHIYLTEHITHTFPVNLAENSNIAVEYKGDTCGGEVNGVTITPGQCDNSCDWYTENFCTVPEFLINVPPPAPNPTPSSSPTLSPSPSSSPSPSPLPSSTTSSSSSSDSPAKTHLGGGAIFAIVLCVLLIVGAAAGGGYYYYKKKYAINHPNTEYSEVAVQL